MGASDDAGVSLAAMADSSAAATPVRRRVFQHPGRVAVVAIVMLIVLNLAIVVLNESDTSQGGGTPLPATIESVLPEPGTIAGPVATIVADLDDTLTGVLLISQNNGPFVEIPEDQLDRVVGLGQVAFRPGPNKDITRFTPGTLTVSVLYWSKTRVGGRPKHPASYTWSFQVKA
jgi:hypothetical protein